MLLSESPQVILMFLVALAIAIPIHEFAHARSAVSYGDDTPRRQGRLSIAPWDHFDPLGAIMCVVSSLSGFGLGWGKPVLVDPARFRNPRWDDIKCAGWGPLSNFLLAIGFAMPIRFGWLSYDDPFFQFCLICLRVNLGLMLFNLIPIYPLDGSHIMKGLLPRDLAWRYNSFMLVWGIPLMFLLIFAPDLFGVFDPLRYLVGVPSMHLARLLLGVGGG